MAVESSASNLVDVVVLLGAGRVLDRVGELDPKEPDGGPGDERRALHLLAVPLSVAGGGSPPVPGDDGGLVSDADTPD